MEKIIAHTSLHNFLDGITAGVCGLIGFTAIQLMVTNIKTFPSLLIMGISLTILIKYRSKYTAIGVIAGAGIISLVWHYLSLLNR